MIPDNRRADKSPDSTPLSAEIRDVLSCLRDEVREVREQVQSLLTERSVDRDKSLLSREEAAERLGISTRLLDDLADQGEIDPVRIRGRVLYRPDTLHAYVRQDAEEDGQS
jgi:excisionase family DNA binding protein